MIDDEEHGASAECSSSSFLKKIGFDSEKEISYNRRGFQNQFLVLLFEKAMGCLIFMIKKRPLNDKCQN